MRLTNKIALVTGAGRGLGEAISRRFAAEDATVIVTDINASAAQAVADNIIADGGKAWARQQDVTEASAWPVLLQAIIERYGQLDILVNNAGIVISGSVESCSLEDWRRTQAVNSDAVFLGCQAAINVMKPHGGSIINISSIEGIIGEALTAAYNASKGAVRLFTKSAALHCAEQGYNIRVNSVHPGFIATDMVREGVASMPAEIAANFHLRIERDIPLRTMGEPIDIANGCLYLASDEARYVTGSELVIDGGYTCR